MSRLYSRLRSRIRERGWTCADIAEDLGITAQSFSNRMNNKTPFDLAEIYKIMDLLEIPYNEMHLYFSKGGMWVEPTKPQRMRIRFTREAI